MLLTRCWPWNKADENISLCWNASLELSPLRVLYQKDLRWRSGPACWTGVWIQCQSLHQPWAQAPAQGTRDTTIDEIHKSCPWWSYIGCLWERETNNEANKWYRMSEGDGAKEKLWARKKNRPQGVGWVCSFKQDQRREQTKVIEGASSVSLPGKGKKDKGPVASRTERGNRRGDEGRLWEPCKDWIFYCHIRMRYAGQEFCPRKFRIVVYMD